MLVQLLEAKYMSDDFTAKKILSVYSQILITQISKVRIHTKNIKNWNVHISIASYFHVQNPIKQIHLYLYCI
mgnify:CR=1 FL=1